jgi:hypothetical protein
MDGHGTESLPGDGPEKGETPISHTETPFKGAGNEAIIRDLKYLTRGNNDQTLTYRSGIDNGDRSPSTLINTRSRAIPSLTTSNLNLVGGGGDRSTSTNEIVL